MTLFKSMSTIDTVLTLSGASTFPGLGGIVLIGSEQIGYAMSSDDQLYGLTRGINGTSAATHAVGATVTLLESVSMTPGSDPKPLSLIPYRVGSTLLEADAAGEQTDPASITQAMIDGNTVLWIFGHVSNFSGSLPTPTVNVTRKLLVIFTTDAAKTCSVNSVSIAAGAGQLFVYSSQATAWFAC
jgi:hypothetical protein